MRRDCHNDDVYKPGCGRSGRTLVCKRRHCGGTIEMSSPAGARALGPTGVSSAKYLEKRGAVRLKASLRAPLFLLEILWRFRKRWSLYGCAAIFDRMSPHSEASSVGIGLGERYRILRYAYEFACSRNCGAAGTVVPVEPQVFAVLAYLVQNRVAEIRP